jgi:ferredoxin-NADP reductase
MSYKTTLNHVREVASGTMEFIFNRPEGFTFQAGQSIDLTLIKPPETDDEGDMRSFSLAGAPHEEGLRIATRIRDTAFKRTLKGMAPGTEVSIKGPFGSFTLHENTERPAAFLAGGIGITPFRSITLDALERKLPHSIYLFYSNRTPADAPFLDELKGLDAANGTFTLVATMTDSSDWEGEKGYIDAAMLGRHLPEGKSPIYYLAGPDGMVTAMRTMLNSEGVSNDDIRVEQFAGY